MTLKSNNFRNNNNIRLLSVLNNNDTSGTVQVATAAFTTSNGVNIDIGDSYILFPDGNTWSVPEDMFSMISTATVDFTTTNGVDVKVGEQYLTMSNGDTWGNDISVSELNNPLLEFFKNNFLISNTIDVENYVDEFGIGVKLQDVNPNNSFITGVDFDIPDNLFRIQFEIRKETTNKPIFVDLRRVSDNALIRLNVNPTTGIASIPAGTVSVIEKKGSFIVDATYNISQPNQDYRIVLSPDFGTGEDCNVFYSFNKFYSSTLPDTNRERWEVTMRNVNGQAAGDDIFPFERDKLVQTHNSRLVSYNNDNTWTISTGIHPVQIILNAHTIGATGVAERISYIKENGVSNGTRLPNSTDGVFGGAVPDVPATAIIPPNTTIGVQGRSVSSGNNQALEIGASIEFIELIEYNEEIPNVCEYSKFLSDVEDLFISVAHEGAGGTNMTLLINDTPVTYDVATLDNAVQVNDVNGDSTGQVNFSGGANQNFNRSASTVESFREVNEKVTITKPDTGQFDTQIVTFSNSKVRADQQFGMASLRFTNNAYQVRDSEGNIVFTGGGSTGTWEVFRTLSGFRVVRNGAIVYEDECTETLNLAPQNPVNFTSNSTGYYRVGLHEEVVNTTTNAVGTNIDIGIDLTQCTDADIFFYFADQGTGQVWESNKFKVSDLLESFTQMDSLDGFLHIFDNDWIRLNIVDPVLGILNFVDMGRDMQYRRTELYCVLEETNAIFEIQNIPLTGIVTTGTFQILGDPNQLITDENGAKVHIQYGDDTRDSFVFLDGVARAERKGFNNLEIELVVTGNGQLEIRDLESPSGVSKAWYQLPVKAIGTSQPQSPHSEDSNFISGTVDGDSLLSDLVEGQAYHFQATFGDVNLTSSQEIARSINGSIDIQGAIEPLTIPNGTQGFIRKNSTGGLTVFYTRNEGTSDLFKQLSTWTVSGNNANSINSFELKDGSDEFSTFNELSDNSTNGWGFLLSNSQNPIPVGNKIKVVWNIDTSATQTGAIRLSIASGTAGDVVLNLTDGSVINNNPGRVSYVNTINGNQVTTIVEALEEANIGWQLYPAFGNVGTTGSNAASTGSIRLREVCLDYLITSDNINSIDVISDFSGTAEKTDFLTLSDGRPYTVITDNATTSQDVDKSFNSAITPFLEIEFVRDLSNTHGMMIRANEPGTGRQSQVRVNLANGNHITARSGFNTVEPIVHSVTIEEETIKMFIEFVDLTLHTELEIVPAAHEPDFTPSTTLTGSVGIVGVKLFTNTSQFGRLRPIVMRDFYSYQSSGSADAGVSNAEVLEITTGQNIVTNTDGAFSLTGTSNSVLSNFHSVRTPSGREWYGEVQISFRLRMDVADVEDARFILQYLEEDDVTFGTIGEAEGEARNQAGNTDTSIVVINSIANIPARSRVFVLASNIEAGDDLLIDSFQIKFKESLKEVYGR